LIAGKKKILKGYLLKFYGTSSFLIIGHKTIAKIDMTTFMFIAYGAASAQTSSSQSTEDLRIFSNPISASTLSGRTLLSKNQAIVPLLYNPITTKTVVEADPQPCCGSCDHHHSNGNVRTPRRL
jgi:hypothetical protein